MLEDDRLASLLARAADAFDVPTSGPEHILTLAAGRPEPGTRDEDEEARDEDGDGHEDANGDATPVATPTDRSRRLAGVARRHRLLSAAACLLAALVFAGVLAAALRSPSHPSLTSGLPRTGRSVPAPATAPLHGAPTTTIPAGSGTTNRSPGSASHGGAGAPFGLTPAGPAVTTPTTPTTPATPATQAPALPNGAVDQSAKIEQTGSLSITVGKRDLGRSMAALDSIADAAGGFVANSQSQSGTATGGTPAGSITVQVPVDSFATVLAQAQKLGTTTSLTTKATDVTGQYVDLQSRIAALEDSRQQYLTIMTKATTVGDVLAVQAQLDTIQSQIEQLQGQLQVLSSETAYSSLTTTFTERGAPAPVHPNPVPVSGLVQAWHDSIGGFVAGIEGVIRIAGPLLFALLCLGVVGLGGRALWRRIQRRRL